jgi:L-2-hydroxyglutarate oxidase LhgO
MVFESRCLIVQSWLQAGCEEVSALEKIDCVVIGAGVVGLAIARRLAMAGKECLLLESEDHYGQGISSRNSEVIHAGIYYPENSYKAKLCVTGKTQLYEYCAAHKVGHDRCGKIIVACCADELAILAGIEARARANGVTDLVHLSKAELRSIEPEVEGVAALLSPSTGIVSAHELMTAFLADFENAGGILALNSPVIAIKALHPDYQLDVGVADGSYRLQSRVVVNSTGLAAQGVASTLKDLASGDIPALFLCKGSYFTLSGTAPFNHLIYPVPEKNSAGLGVHATLDLAGQVKFGPDVEYIDSPGFDVSLDRLADYYRAVRRYYPALKDDALQPGYSGIRPKLQGPEDTEKDFCIQNGIHFGLANYINLFGIESPGLTSSLAIADHIVSELAASEH